MGENNANKHPEWRTTVKERISYAIGYNGSVGESYVFQTYLTTYLLMSGISVTTSATVLLFMKIIDAIDDMLFGWIIDRFHPEKNEKLKKFVGTGRFMPWLRLCFYLMPLAVVLLYHIPTSAPEYVKIIWFTVFYLISDLSYTLLDVPMNALVTTMTEDAHERDRIIMCRGMAMIAIVGSVYFGMTILMSEKIGMSISNTVTLFSLILIICMLPMIFNVKEHAVMKTEEEHQDMSIIEALKCLFSNRNLLSYYGGSIVSSCFATGSAVSLFASYYLFGSSLFSLVLTVPTLVMSYLMMVIVPKWAEKRDKNKIRMVSLFIGLFTSAAVFIGGYENIPRYIILSLISMIPTGIATGVSAFLVPNCIEYGKYKTGRDATGFSYAFGTFAQKFPSALASSLALWLLDFFGWKAITAESFADLQAQNIVQSASAIRGLWILTAGLPIIGSILAFICYSFYNLNDQDAIIMGKCNTGEITREEAEARLSKKY